MSPAPAHAQFRPEKGAAIRRADALTGAWQVKARAIGLAVLRTALAMAVSAALCLGALRGWEWARTSAVFAVRSISVRGAVHAKQADLVNRSGLGVGQNLFRIDLAAAARGVEASPWVTSASVSRRFPMAVEIEVTEHAPAAKVVLGSSSSYLVDTHGAVFKKVAEEDGALDLPLVTGIARGQWDEQRPAAQQRILVGIGFGEAWREEGLKPEQLEEIQLDEAGAITALALDDAGQAQEIRVGDGPFGPKLKKLARIREALARRREQASRIDLDNRARPDTVAATLVTPIITSDKATPRGAARSPSGE